MADQNPLIVRRNGDVVDRASGERVGRIQRESYDDAPDEWAVFDAANRYVANRIVRRNALKLLGGR